jgi:PLP dependent protein
LSFTADSVTKAKHEIDAKLDALGVLDRVKIVAVTKGFGPEAVESAIAAGFTSVGENYAQEATAKHQVLAKHEALGAAVDPEWHFIGQLQRNKVKMLAPFINVWQTVDSTAIVDELAKRVPNAAVFIQVNLTIEQGRGGCRWEELDQLCAAARAADLNVLGLMGVAAQTAEDEVRVSFRRLADEAARLDVHELSMGMSGDFEIAVAEGATLIRLGSTLFGPRPLRGREPR